MGSDEKDASQSESELIAALKAGEPSAFVELHVRYLDRVFGYVLRCVPRREDAKDITCEVFIVAFQSVSKFQGNPSLLGWLFGIARRKVADYFRRTKQRPEILETDLPPDQPSSFAEVEWTDELPDELLEREEVAQALRWAVAQLPEAQREAILLHYIDELSIREIAQVMRRSEDAVKALLRRAKATLLSLLAPEYGKDIVPLKNDTGEMPVLQRGEKR